MRARGHRAEARHRDRARARARRARPRRGRDGGGSALRVPPEPAITPMSEVSLVAVAPTLARLARAEEERLEEVPLARELLAKTAIDALQIQPHLALGHHLLGAFGLPAVERAVRLVDHPLRVERRLFEPEHELLLLVEGGEPVQAAGGVGHRARPLVDRELRNSAEELRKKEANVRMVFRAGTEPDGG